jgi:hypothetical protein
VTFVVRGVVSEGPKREGIAIKILGIVEKSQNKVSAPDFGTLNWPSSAV